MSEPFNLHDWTRRWDEMSAQHEATVLLEVGSLLRARAEAEAERQRRVALAELLVALADVELSPGDYLLRPGLWALQEAAKHAIARPWIIPAA